MQVIVAQIGARHEYAIPRMLEEAGCLSALYTDSWSGSGLGRAGALLPVHGSLRKLRERQIRGVPAEKIFATDRLVTRRLWEQARKAPSQDLLEAVGATFGTAMQRWGVRGATHIYSMFGEGLGFLQQARLSGVRVAIDVFINPVTHRILAAERALYPEWEGPGEPADAALEGTVADILRSADLLLCPGENVAVGVREIVPEQTARIRVVPYGNGTDFGGKRNLPEPGRVLFGGTADLRKGIHYFAQAAKLLRRRGFAGEFRVAGDVREQIAGRAECSELTFLGRIPKSAMREEFLAADVLVLPSLAEGAAGVIGEATVAGLPVIVTPSAGGFVRDGVNGRLVPERDAGALADAVAEVVLNRGRREALADGTREIVPLLQESAWRERLVAALQDG